MPRQRISAYTLVTALIALLLVSVATLLFVAVFERLPVESLSLAIDWKSLWQGIRGGEVRLGVYMLNPPWAALMVLPLGLLSFRASWGILGLLTIATVILSVPRASSRRRALAAMLLFGSSFLTIRQVVDGNLEFLVIAGILLVVHGYRRGRLVALGAGILMATAKPQEVALLMPVLGLYLLLTYPWPRLLKLAAGLALIIAPLMLWQGEAWIRGMFAIQQRGSIMDMNLYAGLMRAGAVPPWLGTLAVVAVIAITLWVAWTTRPSLTREKAALLVAASLLVAPYSAANSILVVLVIGVIPLFQKRPPLGLALVLVSNLALFFNNAAFSNVITWFWTAYLCVLWLVLCGAVLSARGAAADAPGVSRSALQPATS